MIQIVVEKAGGRYALWVNGSKMRMYSQRGRLKALDDAALAAKILSDMGFATTVETPDDT